MITKLDKMRKRARALLPFPALTPRNINAAISRVTAESIDSLPQKVDPKPIVEVGDMIKIGDKVQIEGRTDWYEVQHTNGWPNEVYIAGLQIWAWWPVDKITDVYTKAEQQANGALVFVHQFDIRQLDDLLDGTPVLERWHPDLGGEFGELHDEAVEALGEFRPAPDYDALVQIDIRGETHDGPLDQALGQCWTKVIDRGQPGAIPTGGFNFLTPEAAAALGSFQPVPDRAIVPGDLVRDEGGYLGTVLAPDGLYFKINWFDTDHDPMQRLKYHRSQFSLVAPEDPAYREAKERGEEKHFGPITQTDDGREWVFRCDACGFTGDHHWRREAAEGDRNEHSFAPSVIKEPDPAPMPCEGRGVCNCHVITSLDPPPNPEDACTCGRVWEGHPNPHAITCPSHHLIKPDPAPSIPESWDLITAGDGRTYRTNNFKGRDGRRVWFPVMQTAERLAGTDAEILALGPVRRAVVVTLPDTPRVVVGHTHSGQGVTRYAVDGDVTPEEFAAELLAAALHAGEGEK